MSCIQKIHIYKSGEPSRAVYRFFTALYVAYLINEKDTIITKFNKGAFFFLLYLYMNTYPTSKLTIIGKNLVNKDN